MESDPKYPMTGLKITLFPEEGVMYVKADYYHATAFYEQEVFILNRDFTVESIKLQDKMTDFSVQIVPLTVDYTIKEITISEIKGNDGILPVIYRGKLDGTTGFAPYVKEMINKLGGRVLTFDIYSLFQHSRHFFCHP